MSDNRLPTEVELAYEVLPCNALRTAQEPNPPQAHACAYFRRWGRYHSYDYQVDGPPPQPGIEHPVNYVGRAPLTPELLSGCRKAPIMAVGINPNLPGWWKASRNAINPLFDDYKQYAHYFRYRTTAKLQIPKDEYTGFRDGQADSPLSEFELSVPVGPAGSHPINAELQAMKMYQNYQSLLDDLATAMGWTNHQLSIGEDVSYGNMVACPSAKWITQADPNDPEMPPMTIIQQRGIVNECFRERKYFLRQLFQSLPAVLMVFSQSTADAFLGEMQGRFSQGNPQPGDRIKDLLDLEIRLKYGTLPDGTSLEARVIFSPHITGNPSTFAQARAKVLAQLIGEAQAGRIKLNPQTKHLERPRGACVFCTMLEIGKCDYEAELRPLTPDGGPGPVLLTAEETPPSSLVDKRTQNDLLAEFLKAPRLDNSPTPGGPALLTAAEGTLPPPDADASWLLAGQPNREDVDGVPPDLIPALLAGEVDEDTGPTFVLTGRVVTMDGALGVIKKGRVAVSKGKIVWVGPQSDPLPDILAGARTVDVKGTIYPGLIDLHNHFAYNVLPLWVVPLRSSGEPFSNRSQWPKHKEYKPNVTEPLALMAGYTPTAEAIVRYVETKALVGGTTTGQGIRGKAGVQTTPKMYRGAMRNVEETNDERLPEASSMVPNLQGANPAKVQSFRNALEQRRAYFYHLSEGADNEARSHFVTLSNHNLLRPSLVGIHALGLAPEDLKKLGLGQSKIVWSPYSNQLLYRAALNLTALKESELTFGIGCDWTPTGSRNLLFELKVARYFARKDAAAGMTSEDLVSAVTANAARVVSWDQHLGRVRKGALADLVVISGTSGDPYDHLIDATEANVSLVVIHGVPRYGDKSLMNKLNTSLSHAPEKLKVAGKEKLLYTFVTDSILNHVSFKTARQRLQQAMGDLPAFRELVQSVAGELNALGDSGDDGFTLVLDNEYDEVDESPTSEAPFPSLLAAAEVELPPSIELDPLETGVGDYWQRVAGQPNLPTDLKEELKNAY